MVSIQGGQNIYGAPLGMLMLETRFPRISGDLGHASTWPFPIRYRVVRTATARRVVQEQAQGLLQAFVGAAQDLIQEGCQAIATNCGFLILFQRDLSEALSVPVVTSSLLQIPAIQTLLPENQRVAILTVSQASLGKEHLRAACAQWSENERDQLIIGGPAADSHFTQVILQDLQDQKQLDPAQACHEMVQAAKSLVTRHPEIGALVLECTNMIPYAHAIQAEIKRPVWSMFSSLVWLYESLLPRRF